jgi:purine-binding chemotaxis protein CheW
MQEENYSDTKPYLTFTLDNELFSVEVGKVREVLDFTNITKIPRTPPFMRGVINLRGSVVPVVDLRLKFGMSKTENTISTCIIVMEITMDSETLILGALADSVQEVFELGPESIQPPPHMGTKLKTGFLKGMGRRDDNFIMILDIDKVFSSDELIMLDNTEKSLSE